MGCTFKIGDIVHAKMFDRYAVTDRQKPCKVLNIDGDFIKILPEGYDETFFELYENFELFPMSEMLHKEDKVELLNEVGENGRLSIGTKLTFISYCRFGVKVKYDNNEFEIGTHQFRKVHSGLLI